MATAIGCALAAAAGLAAARRWLRPERTGPKTLDGKVLRTGRYVR